MTCRSKVTDNIRILFHCSISKREARQRLQQMKPDILAAWKEMENYRRAEGEKFYDVSVRWKRSDLVSDPSDFIVKINFLDRGVTFENDLVRVMGRVLKGKWGMSAHLKLNKLAIKKVIEIDQQKTPNHRRDIDTIRGFYDAVV